MIRETVLEIIKNVWPMIFISIIILSSIRLIYFFLNKEPILLYKEIFSLLFVVYIMILFYIVTFQDINFGTNNFIPFKEMFRYELGSQFFFKNVIGNILLFVPFGIFTASYLKSLNILPTLFLTIVASLAIEFTQLQIGRVFDIDDIILNVIGGIFGFLFYFFIFKISSKLPRFLRSNWFLNLITIILLAVGIFLFYKWQVGF